MRKGQGGGGGVKNFCKYFYEWHKLKISKALMWPERPVLTIRMSHANIYHWFNSRISKAFKYGNLLKRSYVVISLFQILPKKQWQIMHIITLFCLHAWRHHWGNKVVKTSASTMVDKALQHWFCVILHNCTVLTPTVCAGKVLEAEY